MAGYFPSSMKSSGGGMPDFSTSEVNTGVKWINGKDIYCLVHQETITINNSGVNLSLNVNDFDDIISSTAINTGTTKRASEVSVYKTAADVKAISYLNYDATDIIIYFTKP